MQYIQYNTIADKIRNFLFAALLSAAEIPLTDEQKSEAILSTSSSLEATSTVNETIVTTQAVEKSTPSSLESSSENASVEDSSPTDTRPPLVFPADEDKLTPKNDTALKILQKISAQSSEVIDEVMG